MELKEKDPWFVKPTWGVFLGLLALPIFAVYLVFRSNWNVWQKAAAILMIIISITSLIYFTT